MGKKRYDNKRRLLRKGESQKNDTLYMYRWIDQDKKRKVIYASSLEELRQEEDKLEKKRIFNVAYTGKTLNEQIELYLSIKVKLADSTRENYRYYFEHSIENSTLGRKKIKDIKKSDILLFYSKLTAKGYSAGTIKILQKIIRPSLQLACDDEELLKNPADDCVKEYTEEAEKKYALTLAEEKEFLERILSRPRIRRYYPFYAIILKVGFRISEAIGLTWDDVDMVNREIHIDHQVQYRYIDGKVQYYACPPKTAAGNRTFPMSDEVYQLFVEQRKVWLASKKDPDFKVGEYKNFVFVSHVTGKCMNHNSVRRMLRNIVAMNSERKVQLPEISPHILRHTAICRFAEAGCDIKVLQYLVGQVDVRVTMRVYNHVDKERIMREMRRLQWKKNHDPNDPNCDPISAIVM